MQNYYNNWSKVLKEQLSGININQKKKKKIQALNPYLDYLTDPGFQKVNRLFVLSFENSKDRTVHTKYYLPTVEDTMLWLMDKEHMITFEKLQLMKEMITLLVVY